MVRGLEVWESNDIERDMGDVVLSWGLSTLEDHPEGFHHRNQSMVLDSSLN